MQYLLEWVWSLYEENKVLKMVESQERMEGYSDEEVVRVINLALLCIQASIHRCGVQSTWRKYHSYHIFISIKCHGYRIPRCSLVVVISVVDGYMESNKEG
ncbi:hypothetical protein SUGI_1523170 [Cryptomeria japonica]|uniref:Uncharacterized protein n=1 Tax=Cryptomeria japonica TaxID=3369 RepID=A0AAD3RRW7_CRYJA|nr:hypothetical protein SUGI_1520860 [Cryptomeria japonica]GLJ59784.1 hypothetical protein SUGI_1523170 [Cryptomeria japonica]